MPVNGGNYVAPKWVDNAAPALDAAELQAMCDAIVKNQGSLKALETAFGGRARMAIQIYVGTGTYGEGNPCSVSADFPIKLAVMTVYQDPQDGHITQPVDANRGLNTYAVSDFVGTSYLNSAGFHSGATSFGRFSPDQKTFFWYTTNAAHTQFNIAGYQYAVLLLG